MYIILTSASENVLFFDIILIYSYMFDRTLFYGERIFNLMCTNILMSIYFDTHTN